MAGNARVEISGGKFGETVVRGIDFGYFGFGQTYGVTSANELFCRCRLNNHANKQPKKKQLKLTPNKRSAAISFQFGSFIILRKPRTLKSSAANAEVKYKKI